MLFVLVNFDVYMPVHSVLSTLFPFPFQPICRISTSVTSQFHRLPNFPHSPRPIHIYLYSEKLSLTLAFSCEPTMESGISSETLVLLCQVTQIHIPTHVAGEI
jgi:hypothetical protein